MVILTPVAKPVLVHVQILLASGHTYRVHLSPDAPLLTSLFNILLAHAQGQAPQGLLQIPLPQGQLYIPAHQLLGLVTDPPLSLEARSPAAPASLRQTPTAVIKSQFVRFERFLAPKDHQALYRYALSQANSFVPTTTSTGDEAYRQSQVLHHFPKFANLAVERVRQLVPQAVSILNLEEFPIGQIEAQLTAHNHGNFYRIHNDNGSPDTADRVLTYVYYFFRQPKSFQGGELRIYDGRVENQTYVPADSFQDLEIIDNSIIFFPSHYLHEVLPIHCPSRHFADGRFTINGWVRRGN